MKIKSVVVAHLITSTDENREDLGSTSTIDRRNSHKLENRKIEFLKVLLRFTGTCTPYITFFDVKFEHPNLQGPFCELLSHTTSRQIPSTPPLPTHTRS